ncbi:hypothetical protein [Tenacibaculum sp. C7A-26P2]
MKTHLLIALLFTFSTAFSQVDGFSVMGIPTVTNITAMNAINGAL